MMLTEVGLGAPHFFMLQVFLKAKLTFLHVGHSQSPSDNPSGPINENLHKKELNRQVNELSVSCCSPCGTMAHNIANGKENNSGPNYKG
jgi:hypothetical protein